MDLFYHLSTETKKTLHQPWISSYSGGKDSTCLVSWIEFLRRTKQIIVDRPRLVQSDTTVEYPFISQTSKDLLDILRESGWDCVIVEPKVNELLYCQIFGRGLPPIHPAQKRMRWCTRATKIDPMRRHRNDLIIDDKPIRFLTGVRWGESSIRDGKLKVAGCSAGGECGTDMKGENVSSPIVNWTTCQVYDWMNGLTDAAKEIKDLVKVTKRLAAIYKPEEFNGLSLRFGCIGCPALSRDKVMDYAASSDKKYEPLRAIYAIWKNLYKPEHRLCKWVKDGKKFRIGPIRMESRKRFFAELMGIQQASGVELVNQQAETFIRQCWENKIYPKGWSANDEMTTPDLLDKYQAPLFLIELGLK